MASHNQPQTGLMATYDANDTTVMANGRQIFGYGEDTMFTASYDNETVTVKQDPQGTGVASKNNKTGGTITLNIDETSPSNTWLEELANAGNFPVDIITSTIHITATHCYISKRPDTTGAATSSNKAWQIKALNMSEVSLVD